MTRNQSPAKLANSNKQYCLQLPLECAHRQIRVSKVSW